MTRIPHAMRHRPALATVPDPRIRNGTAEQCVNERVHDTASHRASDESAPPSIENEGKGDESTTPTKDGEATVGTSASMSKSNTCTNEPRPPFEPRSSPTPPQPQPPKPTLPASSSGSSETQGKQAGKTSPLDRVRTWSKGLAGRLGKGVERARSFFKRRSRDAKAKRASPKTLEDERDAREARRKSDWLDQLQRAQTNRQRFLDSSRTQRLCWDGIPGSLRGRAWSAVIGNELKITPELFKINLTRGRKLWAAQIGAKTRAQITESVGSDYSREDCMRIIEADIPRTFPQLSFFKKNGGPLYGPLLEVLQAYVCYRPDMGYVQGMSYIAAILLLNMSKFEAFVALANLLNQDMYHSFFRMDVGRMDAHIEAYRGLMKDRVPALSRRFDELEVRPGMYLYEWLLTVYSRSLKLDTAHRIWDNFLILGQVFLFRTAIGLLRIFESKLMVASFEECVELLNRLPEDQIHEKQLFNQIAKVPLTARRFEKMVKRCEERALEEKKQKEEGKRRESALAARGQASTARATRDQRGSNPRDDAKRRRNRFDDGTQPGERAPYQV